MLKNPMEALGAVDFTNCAVPNYFLSEQLSKLTLSVCQKILLQHQTSSCISSIYVCNISTKCWKDPMKAWRVVDFRKYALSSIIY